MQTEHAMFSDMERELQILEWLRRYSANKGKMKTFLRCKPYLQFAAEKLAGRETMHRRNVVSKSLDWIQSFQPVHENDIQFFDKLPKAFTQGAGIRTQFLGVFELMASTAFIELARGMICSGESYTLCCYELRPRLSNSKITHLNERGRDAAIQRDPNILAMASERGIGYLATEEEYFVDLRQFIGGLNLLRSMFTDMRENMQRCGLLVKDGQYAPITTDVLPMQSHGIRFGPFHVLTTAEKRRMSVYVDKLSGLEAITQFTPEDATDFEKTLAVFAQDLFPVMGQCKLDLLPYRKAYQHRASLLAVLAKEASAIESAPVALCQWGAFEALACLLRHRGHILPNFIHLSRWREFLTHCIAYRHWDIIRMHYPFSKTIASWHFEWPAQLRGLIAVLKLKKIDCTALSWSSKTDANVTLFELLQGSFKDEALRALAAQEFDPTWCDPRSGKSLLHAACEKGDCEVLGALLKNMKTLHFRWRGHDGLSPFHSAVASGSEEVVCYLLQQQRVGERDVAVCWKGGAGTPLQTAAMRGLSFGTVEQIASFYSRDALKDVREKISSDLLLKYKVALYKKNKRRQAERKAKRVKLS